MIGTTSYLTGYMYKYYKNILTLIISIFQTLTQLPAILKEEEDEAFNVEACQSDTDDIINKQHNSAVRTIAIGHIVDKVTIKSCRVWLNYGAI